MSNFSGQKQSVTATALVNDVGKITYNAVDLGSTDGGATITSSLEDVMLSIDQLIGNVINEKTNQTIQITFNLAEPSLANLAYAMNIPQTEITSAASSSTYNIIPDNTAIENQLIIHGKSPSLGSAGVFLRTVTFPRAVAGGASANVYTKGALVFVPITFDILINASTKTFGSIVDDHK